MNSMKKAFEEYIQETYRVKPKLDGWKSEFSAFKAGVKSKAVKK